MTLLCVSGVDSFIPELEHFIEKLFHGLFSKKKPLKSDSWIEIHKMKLMSTSSAEKNFPDEITWITWKTKQNLEIWPFLNLLLEKWVWQSCPKFVFWLHVVSGGTRIGQINRADQKLRGHSGKKLHRNQEIVVNEQPELWVNRDSWLRVQMCPFLEPNTNAQIVFFCHIYCAYLWTHVDAIVTASCAVSNRESRYPRRVPRGGRVTNKEIMSNYVWMILKCPIPR